MVEEVSEEEIAKLEEELKKLEDKDSGFGSPSTAQKDSLYKFCRDILKIEDTTRIGNLTNAELGITKLGVRHYQEIAAYAEAEGLDIVGKYLMNKSQIITSTSMSRKGFWAQLFFTNIKQEKKVKEPVNVKKSWFGKKQEESE